MKQSTKPYNIALQFDTGKQGIAPAHAGIPCAIHYAALDNIDVHTVSLLKPLD